MGSVLLAAALVAYNAVANRWKPFHGWAYVPANLLLTAAVLAAGVWGFGMDHASLGLRLRDAWIGFAIGFGALVVLSALLASRRGRRVLRDRRLQGVRGRRAAFVLGVRIPVGTALAEEIAFRGVLLGSLLGEGTTVAVLASSIAFGLWHVVPAGILARTNRLGAAIVPGGVVLTTAAGLFLGWLRVETGSLAAPLVTHALINSLSAGAALVALSRDER